MSVKHQIGGFLIGALVAFSLAACDPVAEQPKGDDVSTYPSIGNESTTEALLPESTPGESTNSTTPFVRVGGRYPEMSIAELRDGNDFVVKVTVDAAGPTLYNTVNGDPPVTTDVMDPGNLLFSVVTFTVDEEYKNDTGSPLSEIVALVFGGERAGSAMLFDGSTLYSAGQTGILFGGPIPSDLAQETMGQAVQEDATMDNMYPAKVGMWCPIDGDEVQCHPLEMSMELQDLISQLD
ncbi:MAG: hypothetical protein IPL60_08360 [Ardenticatenia bacterium]|nr:hypothetical protein [Ardenticatenia bacterium]